MSGEPRQVVAFSLKDAPSLIERVFPAQKISAEAQKERKAGAGQTLTALGSYWKGRKPLILVRACVLGALLPATDDPEKDLAIFEKLMAIDDDAFEHRVKKRSAWPGILARSYLERVNECLRPEELPDSAYDGVWDEVNEHLGTSARSFAGLVEQLGIMRFGRRPVVADTFAGGGSIPFEAARLGCDVFASDLNPIACMLTWGGFNIVGSTRDTLLRIRLEVEQVVAETSRWLDSLGVDTDGQGNRAKAYLYCLETRCPKTGWMVPLAPSWTISKARRTVAVLIPVRAERRFDIQILIDATDDQMAAAVIGTVRNSALTYELDGEQHSTPIRTLRGDAKRSDGSSANALRPWDNSDLEPRSGDVFQERLYCVQWMSAETLERGRPETFFAAPTADDLNRERQIREMVAESLGEWQERGYAPNMRIEPGQKTDELIRTRGWTHWHHLFSPRHLLYGASILSRLKSAESLALFPVMLDKMSKLTQWHIGHSGREGVAPSADNVEHVFYNQAFNTFANYGQRAFAGLRDQLLPPDRERPIAGEFVVATQPASSLRTPLHIGVTDPPYADAVIYDEITEYFIAWLRSTSVKPFASWTWDSRRALAIRGEGEEFRQKMVEAYSAMAKHMPDNGLQIVMFTHQSGEVWADMAQIFWGAGLQVMAAWYIATETTSELKKGGYVQGTVILVLRKRKTDEAGYRDEVVQEIKAEVARQIDTMVGLNQSLKGHGRIENLFEDADLQMAGYAAALRVLTAYARIDGTDMTREALRPRKKGEKSLVSDIIEFAVQVANEHLVPEGMDARVWERLSGSERFYLKMLDIETTGAKKLDNYQNFAKAFRVPDYTDLMHGLKPNDARLKSAAQFKKAGFDAGEFGRSPTRAALFALYELQTEVEGDIVMGHLRDLLDAYSQHRESLIAVTSYIARKRQGVDDGEAKAARILHGLIRNERLGA